MNPGAPGDTHTSVLTVPALPEAGAPGLCSVPDKAQTGSSHPSQQERNPQVLTLARGPPELSVGCVCMCLRCTRMCTCVPTHTYMHSKDVPQPMTGFQEFRNIRDEGIDIWVNWPKVQHGEKRRLPRKQWVDFFC